MLTYKIENKKGQIYTYKYYPYGKDVKVEAGIISINIYNKVFNIEKVAELDEKNVISDYDKNVIKEHINQLRVEKGYEEITDEELTNILIEYKFAEKLILDLMDQIDSNEIKEKGIII